MKYVFSITAIIVYCLLSWAMVLSIEEVQIIGTIEDNTGMHPKNIKVSVWKNNLPINDTLSDKNGNFSFSIPEAGEYDFQVSENNKYYYLKLDSNVLIPNEKLNVHNFQITINKQELKHKCTRMKEACWHLEKNPKNVSFKGTFFNRFPSTMNEFQLFFSSKVPSENIKKEAENYIKKYYAFKLVSDTAYFSKYAQVTCDYINELEIKALDFFSEGLYEYLSKNPEGFFDVINHYNNEEIKTILRNLVRKCPKEQYETIFGKLPAYNSRIYSLFQQLNNEPKR